MCSGSLRHGPDPCCWLGPSQVVRHLGGLLVFTQWFVYYVFMLKSIVNVIRKRPGRPATGQDPVRTLRLSDEFIEKVDAWAARQEDTPGRSEAIRRLVELGLKAEEVTPNDSCSPARRVDELHFLRSGTSFEAETSCMGTTSRTRRDTEETANEPPLAPRWHRRPQRPVLQCRRPFETVRTKFVVESNIDQLDARVFF